MIFPLTVTVKGWWKNLLASQSFLPRLTESPSFSALSMSARYFSSVYTVAGLDA